MLVRLEGKCCEHTATRPRRPRPLHRLAQACVEVLLGPRHGAPGDPGAVPRNEHDACAYAQLLEVRVCANVACW